MPKVETRGEIVVSQMHQAMKPITNVAPALMMIPRQVRLAEAEVLGVDLLIVGSDTTLADCPTRISKIFEKSIPEFNLAKFFNTGTLFGTALVARSEWGQGFGYKPLICGESEQA